MTNMESIKAASPKVLSKKIQELSKNKLFEYIDLEKWLEQDVEIKTFPFIGMDAMYSSELKCTNCTASIETHRCKVVDKQMIYAAKYTKIIDLDTQQILCIPSERISYPKEDI